MGMISNLCVFEQNDKIVVGSTVDYGASPDVPSLGIASVRSAVDTKEAASITVAIFRCCASAEQERCDLL